jgi:hypothetical protein
MLMLRTLAKHALAGAFDDHEVCILADAFDPAWATVRDAGTPFASYGHANATRELLALRTGHWGRAAAPPSGSVMTADATRDLAKLDAATR